MISLVLARRLRDAGVRWDPRPGDRFTIPDRDLDDEVFVVSSMVIDVHDVPDGRIIRFNGTVEWALDTIAQDAVVWLPDESQLRTLAGAAFVALEREPTGSDYRVVADVSGRRVERTAAEPADAYALVLLHLATGD